MSSSIKRFLRTIARQPDLKAAILFMDKKIIVVSKPGGTCNHSIIL